MLFQLTLRTLNQRGSSESLVFEFDPDIHKKVGSVRDGSMVFRHNEIIEGFRIISQPIDRGYQITKRVPFSVHKDVFATLCTTASRFFEEGEY